MSCCLSATYAFAVEVENQAKPGQDHFIPEVHVYSVYYDFENTKQNLLVLN